jgi:23S rRNA (adenine2503-C2)-methyltransferase
MSAPTAPFLLDPLDLTSEAYATACAAANVHGRYAGAIERYKSLFRDGVTRVDNLLNAEIPPVTRIHESESGEGTVRKFLLPLGPARLGVYDRADPTQTLTTESVIIPMIGKKRVRTHTLCVSSQVGCAMGCGFCQTAQMGLLRNLTAREIVQQYFAARHHVGGYRDDGAPGCDTIRNIVFMGMGEPMDNLDEVIKAIAVLTDHRGVGLPMSKVTISTVGRVDGIQKLARQVHEPGWHRLNLAISLNAPNDAIRETIMPINRRFAMSELRTALEQWPIYGAAKICIEYVLIPGVNAAPEHAIELGDFVLGRNAYAGRPALPGLVNVIPYNPREQSPWDAPTETQVDDFLAALTATGVYAKRRRTKGRDQMAACGQLGNLELKRRSREQVKVPVTISTP